MCLQRSLSPSDISVASQSVSLTNNCYRYLSSITPLLQPLLSTWKHQPFVQNPRTVAGYNKVMFKIHLNLIICNCVVNVQIICAYEVCIFQLLIARSILRYMMCFKCFWNFYINILICKFFYCRLYLLTTIFLHVDTLSGCYYYELPVVIQFYSHFKELISICIEVCYNNNNNLICITPVCAKKSSVVLETSVALKWTGLKACIFNVDTIQYDLGPWSSYEVLCLAYAQPGHPFVGRRNEY